MSGLCGWFSPEPGALPISQMAAPLYRFDQAPLQLGEHGAGALALAAPPGSASMLLEDGLLVAAWGAPAETVARRWRSDGPQACAALTGSFVFALLDERSGEALLAVDRAATRALYYQQVGRTLLFASSAEALVQHPGAGREIDRQALYDYLYFHSVPAPAAIYKGQRRLLAGEFLHFQAGRLQRARYWQLQFDEAGVPGGSQAKQALLATLRGASEAALGRQRGGVLLSGGQGSAAIAALLAGAGGAAPRTYTVGFGADAGDTLARARQLARQLGAEHRDEVVGAAAVADAIPRLAAAFDQPLGDPAVLAVFHGAALAHGDGVQRLLCGHGAAELFGARAHYARQARLSQYEKIPSALRQTVVEPLLFQLAGNAVAAPLRRARRYIEQALVGLPRRLEAANLLHGLASDALFEPDFLGRVDPTAPTAMLSHSWWLADGACQVNQLIALDMKYALADQQLPATTQACRLAGPEALFPFLDDALVAFAARLSPQQKLDGMRPGPFLREALRGTVARNARGAAELPPFSHWLHTEPRIRGIAFDSLSDLKRRGIVRATFIDTLLTARQAPHPSWHGRVVWLLMMLEQWFGRHRYCALHTPLIRQAADEMQACRQ